MIYFNTLSYELGIGVISLEMNMIAHAHYKGAVAELDFRLLKSRVLIHRSDISIEVTSQC